MISIVPSLFPLDDGRMLQQILPSRYTLSSNSTNNGPGNSLSNQDVNDLVGESKESFGNNIHLNSMMTTVYKVSNDNEKKPNEASLVFINYSIDSNDKMCTSLQTPRIILLLEEKEMKGALTVLSNISDVIIERRSSSVVFMRLKGGSVFLLSTYADVNSTISELRPVSTKDQGMEHLKMEENIGSNYCADSPLRKSSILQNLNNVINSDVVIDSQLYDGDDPKSTVNETSNGNIKKSQRSENVVSDNIPPPPRFKTLSVVSTNADRAGFQINSREGVIIENEFFIGRVILVLKPQNPQHDPYYNERIFSKKRRVFIMKFQGRVKYKPENTIFCGIEITEQMKLGLVSKGLCNMLLKLLSKVTDDLHFSFGDKNDEEYAHIAFPIYSFADSFIESKPGETPPPIDSEFPESPENRKKRKKSKGDFNWKVGHTYSISFHSMYLNLPSWELINLPMMRNIDLSTFWGEAALRIVLYEKIGKSIKHLKKSNRYIAGLELSYLANSDKYEINPEKDDAVADSLPWEKARPTITRSFDSYSNFKNFDYDRNDNDDIKSISPHTVEELDGTDDSVQQLETDAEADYSQMSLQTLNLDSDSELQTFYDAKSSLEIIRYSGTDKSNFSSNYFCPGWIELFGPSKKKKTFYAFCTGDKKGMVLRSSKDFIEHFQFCVGNSQKLPYNSSRFSCREKTRRILGQTLEKMQDKSFPTFQQKFKTFVKMQSQDNLFLRRKPPSFSKLKLQDDTSVDCYVARFLNESHAREEWAVISDKFISFHGLDKKKSSFRIPRKGVVSVKAGLDNYSAYSSFYFLEIETIGRITYLMFQTQNSRDDWLEKLSTKNQTNSDQIGIVDDPADEFLQHSSLWKSKKRRILNCRQHFLEGHDFSDDHNSLVRDNHPCKIVEDALSQVLKLHYDSSNTNELILFLNNVSSLKRVNANKLRENEKKAFFLNLYHLMVNHAFLVLGFPTSTHNFISYFATVCYQCSDDVFSITELEHCIIRAKGSPPSNFVAKFVIPDNQYEFSLNEKDNRINFAINCGSKSNLNHVTLFTPELIEQQLDYNSRKFLGSMVSIKVNDRKGVSIKLPRICNWYLSDFGDDQCDLLSFLRNYMPDDEKKLIDFCLTGSMTYSVRYLRFVFKCQNLALVPDNEPPGTNQQ